jgi:hypothetical protein
MSKATDQAPTSITRSFGVRTIESGHLSVCTICSGGFTPFCAYVSQPGMSERTLTRESSQSNLLGPGAPRNQIRSQAGSGLVPKAQSQEKVTLDAIPRFDCSGCSRIPWVDDES